MVVRISPDSQKVVKITPCESTKRVSRTSTGNVSVIRDELRALLDLDHPNIVKHTHLGQRGDLVYIEMEFAGTTDLYDRITGGIETIHTKHKWLLQIAKAVEYLHSRNIAHMDIKLENFLVTSTNTLKLIDFDFIVDFSDEQYLNRYYRGSVPYMSPQVMDGIDYDPPANDMWACGVLVYIFATGYMPFSEGETQHIMDVKYYNPPGPYRKIIMYTIMYSENRRLTASELIYALEKVLI